MCPEWRPPYKNMVYIPRSTHSWGTDVPEKLTLLQLVKKGGSSPFSQKPATRPYPESINPIHALPFYVLKIHLNSIPPLMSRCSEWSLSSGFATRTPYGLALSPIPAPCPSHHTLLQLITRTASDEQYKLWSSTLSNLSPVSCWLRPSPVALLRNLGW